MYILGNHRYAFTLYKQQCRIEFKEDIIKSNCLLGRSCFHIRNFAKKYDLGDPVAGMIFVSDWECYVDQVKCKLEQSKKDRRPHGDD